MPTVQSLESLLNDGNARFVFLSELPLFERVSDNICRALAETAILGSLSANRPIIREDRPADRNFIILDGVIRVMRRTTEGEARFLPYRGVGYPIGFTNLGSSNTHTYGMYAATNCYFLRIDNDTLAECFNRSNELYRAVLGYVLDRYNDSCENLQTVLLIQDKKSRALHGLLEIINALVNPYIKPEKETGVICLRQLNREAFAEQLGISDSTLAKGLQILKAHRLIDVQETTGDISVEKANIPILNAVYSDLRKYSLSEAIARALHQP